MILEDRHIGTPTHTPTHCAVSNLALSDERITHRITSYFYVQTRPGKRISSAHRTAWDEQLGDIEPTIDTTLLVSEEDEHGS